MDKVAVNIKRLRESCGFTQGNLADFLGVDQSFISRVERGERILTTVMLDKLSALFGVKPESMLNGDLGDGLSFAFRANDMKAEDMEAVSVINKIALNGDFLADLTEKAVRG